MIIEDCDDIFPVQWHLNLINLIKIPYYIPTDFIEFERLYKDGYLKDDGPVKNEQYYYFQVKNYTAFDYLYYLIRLENKNTGHITIKHFRIIPEDLFNIDIRVVGMFGRLNEAAFSVEYKKYSMFEELYYDFIKNKDLHFSELNTNGIFNIQYDPVSSVSLLNYL